MLLFSPQLNASLDVIHNPCCVDDFNPGATTTHIHSTYDIQLTSHIPNTPTTFIITIPRTNNLYIFHWYFVSPTIHHHGIMLPPNACRWTPPNIRYDVVGKCCSINVNYSASPSDWGSTIHRISPSLQYWLCIHSSNLPYVKNKIISAKNILSNI